AGGAGLRVGDAHHVPETEARQRRLARHRRLQPCRCWFRRCQRNGLGVRLVCVPLLVGTQDRSGSARSMPSLVCTGADVAAARLIQLTYWYPNSAVPALSEVSLDFSEGITLVAGPSGGGKSTLLRVLNGLVPHFHGGRISGRAAVSGADIIRTPPRNLARTVRFVFSDPELQAGYGVGGRGGALGLATIWRPTP